MKLKQMTLKLSYIFVLFIYISMFVAIPSNAITGITILNCGNYSVEYSIINEWDNHQNIEIKITNTGNNVIYNWALGYDAGGDISNVWNGTIHNSNGTNYIIKNAGYNYEILPGNSVTFGYTLQGENLATPDNFELCSKRIEINEVYNTQLVIEDKWENGFSGYIEILNESDIPFEAWMLSFDTNFVISDLWNASIVENEEYTYKVSSQIMSNPILSGSSIKFGITASFKEGVEPVITKELISIVQIDNSVLNNNEENIIDNSDEIVGQMYFKDLSSEDDIICDSDGNRYFKNQVLVTACDGVSFDTINDLAHSMDAEIVGYIELTNDYQLEFNYDISINNLLSSINNLSGNLNVEQANPNIVFKTTSDGLTNDTQIQPELNANVNEHNWHLYAINAVDAWDYYLNPLSSIPTNDVKIGVIDTVFCDVNKDLDFSQHPWNNPKNYGSTNVVSSHGTFVAGIIGANFNNNYGVAGVCPDAKLYGYAIEPNVITDIGSWNSLMHYKYAIALMVGNNVKVINISRGYDINEIGNDGITTCTKSLDNMLNKLLNIDYDFLIVNSGGNDNKDAIKSSFFAMIDESSPVYDHIIIVGAVDYIGILPTQSSDLKYEYRKSSNYGPRIDIVAPGKNIYSTASLEESFGFISGTSAAAPQVAGVAGMIYSINPNLKGSQVKEIILTSAKESSIKDSNRLIIKTATSSMEPYHYFYSLLDAKAAIDMAISINGPFTPSSDKNDALLYGVITDANNNPIKNTKVKMTYTKITTQKTPYILYFETDENGEYLTTLSPNIYNLVFSINNSFKGWFIDKNYAYHIITNKLIEKNIAYPLDIKLDNTATASVGIYDDSNGISISDVIATIEDESGSSQTVTLNSSELLYNDVEDGNYTISLSKDGYVPKTIQVNAMGGNVYDENGEILEKITLTPIEASIYGTVTVKNLTTNETTPKSGHTVKILKDGEVFTSVTTQDDGTYRVPLNKYGDYTVVFDEEHQVNRSVDVNYDYEVNCEFEVEEEDDEEDKDSEDGGDDNSGDNEDGTGDDTEGDDSSDLWSEILEDEFSISTEVDDPSEDASDDNVNVFGAHSVNLKDGLYIDCGEYTYRYYVADYELRTAEIWTAFHKNMLMYDIYKDGVLIDSRNVHCWYKRVVRSSNNKIWVYTEYVSSVGIKIQETNGVRKLYLTYTVNDIWNPQQGGPDTSREHKTYLATINDTEVTVRNH